MKQVRHLSLAASCAAFALLGACASAPQEDTASPTISDTAARSVEMTRDNFGEVAKSPLEDLNIVRDEIPELLRTMQTPYGMEDMSSMTCERLQSEVRALDALLGADFDYYPDEDIELSDQERMEQRAEQVSDATIGYLSGEASGFIPFRGAVRYVTGASKHAKQYARALTIGGQRRAFLKGYGLAIGCTYPAAPKPPLVAESRIVFKGDQPDGER